jgi:hypothetical protein
MDRPAAEPRIYRELPERSRRADARSDRYRFDLDTDVRWHLLGAEGRHVVPSMISGAGLDLARLEASPDAARAFDWAYGMAVCRVFNALEEVILGFERTARALPPSRSLDMLLADERKHIALFGRYAAHLERARPDLVAPFERAFAATALGLRRFAEPAHPPDSPAGHYVFWTNALLFEELTVYYHDRLARPAERELVQPAWLDVHAAHRVEEVQHLVTDDGYLEALDLSPAARDELSELTAVGVVRHFATALVPFAAPLALVEELAPGLGPLRTATPTTQTPLFKEVVSAQCFKRTRVHAPRVARLG